MKRAVFALALLFATATVFAADKPKSNWADFDGNKIHYYDVGKQRKKAIVLIHGWTCSGDFWSETYGAFRDRRVIVIDLIGHGKSDKPKIAYNMDLFARSVAAVLDAAKVKSAVLVGHSMGTPVARQFYRLYPNRTAGIVIVDGALRPYGNLDEMEAFYRPLRANYRAVSKQMIVGMTQSISDEKLRNFINESMFATPEHVGLSAMESFAERKIWETDQIKVPVLAIHAESPAWKPDEETYFRSIAPDLDYRKWSGVGHFLMMEKPADFNAAVSAFIKSKKLL